MRNNIETFIGLPLYNYEKRKNFKTDIIWGLLINLWIKRYATKEVLGNRKFLFNSFKNTTSQSITPENFMVFYFESGDLRQIFINSNQNNAHCGRTKQEIEYVLADFIKIARIELEVFSQLALSNQGEKIDYNLHYSDADLMNLGIHYCFDFEVEKYLLRKAYIEYITPLRGDKYIIQDATEGELAHTNIDVVLIDRNTNKLFQVHYLESIYHKESDYYISPSDKYQNEIKRIQQRIGCDIVTIFLNPNGSIAGTEFTVLKEQNVPSKQMQWGLKQSLPMYQMGKAREHNRPLFLSGINE